MKIYHYDHLSGNYLGSSEGEYCPITGQLLVPAWATTQKPPTHNAQQLLKWQNGVWTLEDIPQSKPESEPELTVEQKLTSIRIERDRLLDSTSWVFQRQQTGTESQKLPVEQYQAWLDYWAMLRDFPVTCDPDNPMWPVQPNF